MNFDKELDASGLSCPMPVLKSKKALDKMVSGQVLRVISTDTNSVKDIPEFTIRSGNPLLTTLHESASFVFYIQKK